MIRNSMRYVSRFRDSLSQYSCIQCDGRTPLHWASRNGHLNVEQWLVQEQGADVNKGTIGESLVATLAYE